MLEMNMPQRAVRTKMEVDGCSIADIDAFFTRGASLNVRDEEEEAAATKITEKSIQKYTKMLKNGIAESAVKQRMLVDRINSPDIEEFFNNFISGNYD